MTGRLLVTYLLIVLGPVALAASAFALRDVLDRRKRASSDGNGHTDADGLEHTVEEVRAR
jgi:hypothetical protein